ncbi:hypothetical protein GCM10007916_37480 [Psychromonas marina]|uniref:Lipoprotein n=1 Tax=Psychromonas marina TaxID=88364 RepID=A0ABQ6E5Q2_9GAMM|nr:lipoprotein [Psychromonas marina]GLS92676.1 hypothetical protein GCM10007916_37480 [Psychromonas marina]
MKKLNLLLIPVLFSSLLAGCGMKGPLYKAPETPKTEKQPVTSENELTEQNKETTEGK